MPVLSFFLSFFLHANDNTSIQTCLCSALLTTHVLLLSSVEKAKQEQTTVDMHTTGENASTQSNGRGHWLSTSESLPTPSLAEEAGTVIGCPIAVVISEGLVASQIVGSV